jgi:hypothetical protein
VWKLRRIFEETMMAKVVEVEEDDGGQEILAPAQQVFDSATLATLQKSEIDQQIATAKRFPRQMTKLLTTATALATADAETAEECIYVLPRGGKMIEGPSVRFAEIMAHSWGNCRCGARVIGEDPEFVTSQGSFFDMEQNVHIGYEVKRRITTSKGARYNSDMIGTTSNAACSIALRNAILRGIPRAIWKKVYAQARQVVAGDIKTLDTRRASMIKVFEVMGVKREVIFAKLGVKGVDDVNLDHLVTLRGLFNSIRENEISADKAFAPAPEHSGEDTRLADKSKANLDKIKEKYAQPAPPTAQGEQAQAEPQAPPVAAAAPNDLQGDSGDNSKAAEPSAQVGPEEAGADSGPAPVAKPADDPQGAQHGIPLAFGEPGEGA